MMSRKCRKCKHYILEYAPLYKAYIEGCDVGNELRSDGCKLVYETKRPKAYIKGGRK